MSVGTPNPADRRRSERVMLQIPVVVRATGRDGEKLEELDRMRAPAGDVAGESPGCHRGQEHSKQEENVVSGEGRDARRIVRTTVLDA